MLEFSTNFYGNDALRVGIDGEVTVQFDPPFEVNGAWQVNFRIMGSKRTHEDKTTGDSALQALELAARFVQIVYELDAEGVPYPRPS